MFQKCSCSDQLSSQMRGICNARITSVMYCLMHLLYRKQRLEYIFLSLLFFSSMIPNNHSSLRVRTVMKNLEKSWNFKTAISRPGKVLEK